MSHKTLHPFPSHPSLYNPYLGVNSEGHGPLPTQVGVKQTKCSQVTIGPAETGADGNWKVNSGPRTKDCGHIKVGNGKVD